MNQLKSIIVDTFTQFWEERQGRERQYIIAAALTLVIALVYLIGIDPAITGREELRKQLPALHLQAAEMQQMARELESLPKPENLQEVDRELIETSLSHNNLKAQTLSVIDGVVRIQFSSTSMAALQSWLLEMQRSAGLFVEEMKITGLDKGLVSANLMLQQANSKR